MIDKIFNEQAIRQNVQDAINEVSKFNSNIEQLKANLSTLTVKVRIDAPQDIATKIEGLNSIYADLKTNLEGISTAQLRAAKAQTEAAKQAKLLADTEARRAKTSRNLQVTEEQVTAALNEQARSMAQAAEQNRILRAAAKQLDLTIEDNVDKLKEYNARINENTEFIRNNSDAATKQKMNIGNYRSVLSGLNTSVAQLVREAPSAKYGLDIFFLAISNNIPMLMDSIKAIEAYNKKMVETGQASQKINMGKALLSSIFSLNTLLMAGVTVLTLYGDEIIEWGKSLFKGKEVTDEVAKAQERLNNAYIEGGKNAQGELVKLRLLYQAYTDTNASAKQRSKALGEIKEITETYLGETVAKEITDLETLNSVYSNLTTSILQSSIAKAKMNEIEKISQEIWEKQKKNNFEELKSISDIDEAIKSIENRKKNLKLNTTPAVAASTSGALRATQVDKDILKNQIKELKELRVLFLQIEEIQKTMSPKEILNLFNDKDTGGSGGDDTKTYAEGTIGWYENYISELNEALKDISDTEVYNEIIAKIEDAQDAISRIKGEKTKYEQILADIISKNEVKSIDDQHNENLAKIEQDYDAQLALIKNKGGELAEAEAEARELIEQARIKAINEENERHRKEIEKEAQRIAKAYINALKEELQKGQEDMNIYDINLDTELLQQETALLRSYNKREINEKDYQQRLTEIQINGQITRLKHLKESLQEEYELLVKRKKELTDKLGDPTLSDAEREAIKIELSSPQFSDNNLKSLGAEIANIDAQIDNLQIKANTPPDNKGWEEWASEITSILGDVFSQLTDIVNAYYDNLFAKIDQEREANERASEEAIANLDRQYEQGIISQEEYETRKRYQEELTAQKEEELRQKELAAKQKQAKWEKAMAIAQAGIDTASAIIGALKQEPPLSFILAALYGAMGAAQIAVISSTPLPMYAKGTDYHKGGLAIVGDGGKNEVVMTDRGAFITPDTPTVVDIPRGARVLPDVSMLNPDDVHWSKKPFIGGLSYDEHGEPIIINDYSRLEKEFRAVRGQLEKQSRMMQKAERNRQLSEYKRRKLS